jgi:group I intron endonuclease
MTMGIYKIVSADGRVYIGQSAAIEARWLSHRADLRQSRHNNARLMEAWQRLGSDAFEFSVLEIVDDRKLLNRRERHWIVALSAIDPHAGYNLTLGGGAPGKPTSMETRAKIAAAKLGTKYSIESRMRMSADRKGHKLSEERKAKMRGRVLAPEHRAKLSAALKGRWPQKASIASSAAKKGKPLSAEMRAKLSAAQLKVSRKGKKQSPTHRANRLAAVRAAYLRKKAAQHATSDQLSML